MVHSVPVPLRLNAVSRRFGVGPAATTALADVDLTLQHGSFTAIMGPSGSGKTTLLNVVAGLDQPTSGGVQVAGVDMATSSQTERARARRDHLGIVFQEPSLIPYLSAAQNVALPRMLAGARPDPERIRGLLDRVGLADRADALPEHLSGGQQQRVGIARALMIDPILVLADEPTGALDSANGHTVLTILRSLVADSGRSVLMVTHDPQAAACADRVLFLFDGRLVDDLEGSGPSEIAARLAALAAESAVAS